MPGISDIFREIHRLRRHARDLQQEIDRAPIQLKARKNLVAKAADGFKAAQDDLKKLKVTVHDKESQPKKHAHADRQVRKAARRRHRQEAV